MDRVKGNDLIRGKLLSDDGISPWWCFRSTPRSSTGDKLAPVVAEIRKTMDEDLQGSGVTAQLSGVPVMQLEIRQALERDRLVYNAIGFSRAA